MNEPVFAVQIIKYNSAEDLNSFTRKESEDLLAVEEPLEIRLIYGSQKTLKNLSVTMRTPGNDEDLATGFLFTEGIIRSFDQILGIYNSSSNQSITVELDPGVEFDPVKMERHFYTSSSCGVCGKSSIEAVQTISSFQPASPGTLHLDAGKLTALPITLQKQQEVFQHTGGLHASALFSNNYELLELREDVGRHNALDKLIGSCLKSGTIPLDSHILLLSGRASFELVQKAAMAGLRVVCAVGAPSSLAVELAENCGMTLVGFLRGRRFNIYTGAERVNN
jgi:FdhD protein